MPPDLLMRLALALELGDWRSVVAFLFSGQRLGGAGDEAVMIKCMRYVGLSMRAQCATSDAALAEQHLNTATRLLALLATGAQAARPDMLLVRQRLASLVEREQADLAAVRRTFSTCAKGRQELVYACVEYLIWVDEDPYRPDAAGSDQELLGLDDAEYHRFWPINRTDMIARATRLRQFAGVRGGSISERTWQRLGGAAVLEAAALRVLANGAREPQSPALSVRLARRDAEENAWKKLYGAPHIV